MTSIDNRWTPRVLGAATAALMAAALMAGGCGSSNGTSTSSGAGGAGGPSCGPDATKCSGACIDTKNDPANCGACGNLCPTGQVCSAGVCGLTCLGGSTLCGDKCIDKTNDPANCGACANACPAGQVCSIGSCAMSCVGGSTLCGSKCIDETNDPANCGMCGNACPAGQVCSAGTCGVTCLGGSTLCGSKCIDKTNDPANCGTCAHACPGAPNATAVCQASTCGITCVAPYGDCNVLASDGCEKNLAADVSNCGACGKTCPAVANGTAGCAGSTCGIAACNTGFDDCDNIPATGCETSLDTDKNNCGMCNHVCPVGQVCANGACQASLGTIGNPGPNCRAILAGGGSNGDGAYWVNPLGTAFQAYCDMTTDGGGWTRVAGINGADTNHVTAAAVNAAGMTTAIALGKFADNVINALKSGFDPGYRLRCQNSAMPVTGYFSTTCPFSANPAANATGTCTAISYVYSPPEVYGGQYTQVGIVGVSDGDHTSAERLIYGANPAVYSGTPGCDTGNAHWGGNGSLWIR